MAMLEKIHDTNPVSLVRKLRDGWNLLIDDYMSRRLTAGPGIRLTREPAGTVISSTARGGGNVAGGDAGYANYFAVEAVEGGVRIFDGGNPESPYAGLTDVDTVSAGTLSGPFADGTYICLRLGVSNNAYTQTFEAVAENLLPAWNSPVWPIAQIVGGNVVQRWTGGMIFWRSRFIIGFGRGNNLS